MAEIFNEEIRQTFLKKGNAGLAKVGDFSGAQLKGQVARGETQMVSSNKNKRGSSLLRLPDDILHYMTSFLLIKDLLRLDSAWTVRSEREKCWLPVLHKFFGHSPVLLETGKYELIVSDSVFLRLSRAWINARSLPLARVIAPYEHGLSVELERLVSVTLDSFSSFKSDLAAVSSWLRANSLPAPKHTLDVIFTGNEIGATRAFQEILSIDENPPIQQIIDMGVVPRCVEFLHRSDNPVLQLEAAWALTNIASGNSEHTQCVVAAGAVPIFIKLLTPPHHEVCEQAACALGNISVDSVPLRDLVLQHGALPALVELGSTFSNASPLPLVRNVSCTLHNLCRKKPGCEKPAPPLDLVSPALPLLARLIHSNDMETVTDACWALYYMSEGPNDRIEAVLHAGVAPRLVELLHDETKALIPALCTVSNFVSGNEAQAQRILIDARAVPIFVKLLASPHQNICRNAVRALGNCVARDSVSTRDLVLQHGALPALVELGSTFSDATPLPLVGNVSWALSNLCLGKPAPPLDLVSPALPLLARLIHNNDEKTVTNACWALCYISEGPKDGKDRIEAVLHAGVAPRLVELLHDETTALSAALSTVGNFVTGDDAQTQRILDLNVLPTLLKLLDNPEKDIRKEAAFTVSNIACGTRDQIQAVIEAGLVPKLIELLQTADVDVQKEAARAVSNTTCGGDADQIMYVVQQGAIPPMCKLLGTTQHYGVTCDECGICPITGVRYKCLVRDNFDLCSACEAANPQPFAMMMTKPEVVEVVLTGLQNILKKLPPDALQAVLRVIQQCESDTVIKASRN